MVVEKDLILDGKEFHRRREELRKERSDNLSLEVKGGRETDERVLIIDYKGVRVQASLSFCLSVFGRVELSNAHRIAASLFAPALEPFRN